MHSSRYSSASKLRSAGAPDSGWRKSKNIWLLWSDSIFWFQVGRSKFFVVTWLRMKRQNGRQRFLHVSCLPGVMLVILAATCLTAAPNQQPNTAPEIAFTVSLPRPHTHMLDVELRIKHSPGQTVPSEEVLVLPVWTPGSYLIREFERQVQDFEANDAG